MNGINGADRDHHPFHRFGNFRALAGGIRELVFRHPFEMALHRDEAPQFFGPVFLSHRYLPAGCLAPAALESVFVLVPFMG
ncbi:hypothetical protein thsrh120_16600 [Rhizobium sp. No.120]